VTDPDMLENSAQQIADQGRDALVTRLRPAFKEAAAAHSDVLTLDDEQLERMVQRAADRADGLQWRRALASVATEQLGIGLGEALGHPAVARAHAIVGAPSYEEALATVSGQSAAATVVPEPEREPELEPELEPEPDLESERDLEPAPWQEPAADEELEDEELAEPVRLKAVHLGGIANLPNGASDLELRFSEVGLDIARADQPLGRLTWREITAVETPNASGRRRRRQRSDGTVVIRSAHGSATFEIPGVTPEELHDHLAPLLEDH
jgi:hypothetical protein